LFREDLDTHTPPKEQVESYCKDECNDEEPIEEVIHVYEVRKFDDDSLFLEDLFRDDLVTYIPQKRKLNHVVRMYA